MVKLKLLVLLVVVVALSGCTEDVIRLVDTTNITYINASNISVVGAASWNGTLQNISDIDNEYITINESTTPFYVDINFTNVTNFSFVEFKARYYSTSATPSTHVVDFEIWCNEDQAFADFLADITNHGDWQYYTRHVSDYTHFIKPDGNVTFRFNHTANGNVNHKLTIDTTRLIISSQFEQNTVTLNQYFNTTGGGGVSFDGTPKDMNGTNLLNGTISNYSTIEYTNNSLNLKVNKSGDNMTGKLNISITNGTFSGFTMLGSAGTPFMTYYENSTMRSELTLAGIQIWKVRSTVLDPVGYIVYSTPNDKPGIVFYNGSLSRRINLMARDTGVMLNAGNTSSFKATGLLVDTDDNITVSGLTGAGNDYACLDANGKLFRSNAAC